MIRANFQVGFFDRLAVINAMDRVSHQALMEFGRLVRKSAQRSLVYGTAPSRPGTPPTAHKSRTITKTSRSTGKKRKRAVSLLRERLFFAYDLATKSAVIGPELYGGTVDSSALPALEYGGRSTRKDRKGKRKTIRIRKRPFMGPAFEKTKPELPRLFKDKM